MTNAILGLARPVLSVIDKMVSDPDLKSKLQAEVSRQLLDQNSELTKAAGEVITAEANGESWLQRNWRPMAMVFFCLLIGGYWFGFVPVNMPEAHVESMFTLVQLGLGGYVGGRSVEKVAKIVKGHKVP